MAGMDDVCDEVEVRGADLADKTVVVKEALAEGLAGISRGDLADVFEQFDEADVVSVLEEENLSGTAKSGAGDRQKLATRCAAAGLALEEEMLLSEPPLLKIGMKCGRDIRRLTLYQDRDVESLLQIPFENYTFLSGLEAIFSAEEGTIEAAIEPLDHFANMQRAVVWRLFGLKINNALAPVEQYTDAAKIVMPAIVEGLPNIEIGFRSGVFVQLAPRGVNLRLTLKLTGCHVRTHDAALDLLNKTACSVLFQLDLLTGIPMDLAKERGRLRSKRRTRETPSLGTDLQYPTAQFDPSAMALYRYGKSASRMPLLQFLAFYQVMEYFFPVYSKLDAQRKLKAILKEPTFRPENDAHIARILGAIRLNRSGAFGNEKLQLIATLKACADADELRCFIEADPERKERLSGKGKTLPYHKIPLSNAAVDIRDAVAERIYDIRCRIVHAKADERDGEDDLLLPFSPEAEQLGSDIELVEYLAQRVLVEASMPFNVHA